MQERGYIPHDPVLIIRTAGSERESELSRNAFGWRRLERKGADPLTLDLQVVDIVGRRREPEDLRGDAKNALPKLHGALLKNEQDVHLFERLAFLARQRGG